MCFGATGAVVDEIPDGPLEVTTHMKKVLGNFKKSHDAPVRFIIIVLKGGKIDYHNKIRLEKCTYEDYMREITKVVEAGQLASVLHWFRLKEEVKFVRLSFDPKDDKISEENTTTFFHTIKNYLTKNYSKVTFMDLSGSTVQELSIDKLEDTYNFRYPGH